MPPSSRTSSRAPSPFRISREGGESCVNRVFQSGGNRNWKLKNARSMLGSWLLYGGVGAVTRGEGSFGGGRWGGWDHPFPDDE